MLGLFDAGLAADAARADAFAGDAVDRDRDRDGDDIADLTDVLDRVFPVSGVFVEDVGDGVPLDVIHHLGVAAVVAVSRPLTDHQRVNALPQFAERR